MLSPVSDDKAGRPPCTGTPGGSGPAAAASELRAYLQAIYQRYHLPIWLTELGLV
jgi:hypothetical protein